MTAIAAVVLFTLSASPASPPEGLTPAERGYWYLTNKAYLTIDFDEQDLAESYKEWPEPLRSQAKLATAKERRKMAFKRYGLTTRPGDDSGKPLQYAVNDKDQWIMNCFSCHGGQVEGKVIPGLPNSNYALQTLTEETRLVKSRLGKTLSRMDVGSAFIPLDDGNGLTNAVVFGVALLAVRHRDLTLNNNAKMPRLIHHAMDPPPWWHLQKKKFLYIDGFAEKDPRALMQFMLIKENGPREFREWESDYRDVNAFIHSLKAPKYEGEVNQAKAAAGETVFNNHCARCHGTYGKDETYPEKLVPIGDIGTDPVRLKALSPTDRRWYGESWFAHHGKKELKADPGGYVAPPLDGVWATAPYFHNGSVPTLWHVLHPDARPKVWRRSYAGYDHKRTGLEVEEFETFPADLSDDREKRFIYDTSKFGKSNAGHLYPEELNEREKIDLLEYLKTL